MAWHPSIPQDGKELRGSYLNMSDVAIKVENLGKSYQIGHNLAQSERYTALRDVIAHNAKNLARKTRDMFQGKAIVHGDEVEEFWALKDINFEIKQGDRVGIIGRNGAGKSTLLKILSRITEPTAGRVTINGRVASLLEVGTGFHPELTGRENIFLNGAILGMSRREIQRKFDEIVDFAEVERFLDTPVKRYSSGMYVRLAFAVAAHLEPEILVVDEVLAVGDAQFQKKCLGKMDDVAKGGRTVFFVSHNMAAIQSLCTRGILLAKGNMVSNDNIGAVVSKYKEISPNFGNISIFDRRDRRGSQQLKFIDFEIRNCQDQVVDSVCIGDPVKLVLYYQSKEGADLRNVHVSIGVYERLGDKLLQLSTKLQQSSFERIPPSGQIICNVPSLPLQSGTYSLNIQSTVGGDEADWIQDAALIEVHAADYLGGGKLPQENEGRYVLKHSWLVE